MGDRVASAVVWNNSSKSARLVDTSSIFRAELYAISMAMDVIRLSKDKHFVIFSDSMSSLEALSGFKRTGSCPENNQRLHSPHHFSKKTVLCWIPSHVNIPGNERADTTDKSAFSLPATHKKIPASDLIPRVPSSAWKNVRIFGAAALATNFTPSIPLSALSIITNFSVVMTL